MQVSNGQQLRDEAFQLFGRLVARSDPGRLEVWADQGLTMTQLRVLFMLRAEDGLSAGALADSLRVTPSTLTRIMDRLVRHNLVRHCLTKDGQRMVVEVERTGRARMNDILSRLEAGQLERLVLALRDLAAATEAIDAVQSQGVVV